jgi:F-type H+-transporting ATPase subunit a
VDSVRIQLAAEPIAKVGPLTISNTLLSSWLATLLLVVIALYARRKLVDAPKPYSLQNIVETVIEMLYDAIEAVVGAKAKQFFPVVGTFFFFILASNWLTLFPGFGSIGFWEKIDDQRIFVPLLRGPNTDLNTTVALAVCSVISAQVYGVRALGLAEYGSRFFAVDSFIDFFRQLFTKGRFRIGLIFQGILDSFIGLLELFDQLTRVLSFAFRLFGNIFGGEVLLIIIAFLAPYVASIPFLILELFGGFIQAFIFTVLSATFFGQATSDHDGEHDKSDAHVAGQPSEA